MRRIVGIGLLVVAMSCMDCERPSTVSSSRFQEEIALSREKAENIIRMESAGTPSFASDHRITIMRQALGILNSAAARGSLESQIVAADIVRDGSTVVLVLWWLEGAFADGGTELTIAFESSGSTLTTTYSLSQRDLEFQYSGAWHHVDIRLRPSGDLPDGTEAKRYDVEKQGRWRVELPWSMLQPHLRISIRHGERRIGPFEPQFTPEATEWVAGHRGQSTQPTTQGRGST